MRLAKFAAFSIMLSASPLIAGDDVGSLEEAIAGLYGNRPSDVHRIDDRTVADDSGRRYFRHGTSSCRGGMHFPPSADLKIPKELGGTEGDAVTDGFAVTQELNFDEALPNKTRIEKIAVDLKDTKLIIQGEVGAPVMCNVYKSGKRDCLNSMDFHREIPGYYRDTPAFRDFDANRQLVDRSIYAIFHKLCFVRR